MNPMHAQLAAALAHLDAQVFEFTDESHLHAGHAGNRGGGHYHVLLVSSAFEGIGRLKRQRMVQEPLAALFNSGAIHALSIRALSPDEYFN